MEAQKPTAKAKPNAKKNAPGIKNAAWVIVICAIIAVTLFIFWFGNDMHFDEDGHPQNLWGTVYKGGFIVPVLQTLFLTVIVLAVERWIALNSAKGKGNIAKFVAAVKVCLEKNDIAGARALCSKQQGSVAAVVDSALIRYEEMDK
ncbi:MAG: MotA/TolQ/ExbB proton channel family protein, partial [Muribaculaceae bacterium]|nr:MotA/TolQ/ExbB proton channel family protein [Muribaculaceae bacterium]